MAMDLNTFLGRVMDWMVQHTLTPSQHIRPIPNATGGMGLEIVSLLGISGASGLPYFKVTDASAEGVLKVRVAFGRCRVNDEFLAVPADLTDYTEVTITDAYTGGYLCFKYGLEDDAPSFEYSEEMPSFTPGVCYRLIAVLNLNDDKTAIAEIIPTHLGFFSDDILGDCSIA